MDRDNNWHMSKSVPISLIVTLFLQTAGIIWFFSGLNAQVNQNVKDILRHETLITSIVEDSNAQAVTLGRIEENLLQVRRILENDR